MFKASVLLAILGFVLIALFIWFAGPYFAFADYHPLESILARCLLIGLIVAIWGLVKLIKMLKAAQAGKQLAKAVVAQPDATPNPDAAPLRERFEDAIAALKDSRGTDHSLYSLPWYVFIGPPGSGKTTVLENSGLNFPLAQRFGKDALRGVGGTRNCDWWFTDDAVFLDTAGRYTTQDSDPGSDSRGWKEFLGLLRKYRQRRPINGIILTVSVSDLLTQSAPGREAQIAAARHRLDELNRELKIQLPVYLLVTKCDLMDGFTEYFDDLSAEARRQVWGVTFPYEKTLDGSAAPGFGTEFDALVARLNARLWGRLEEEPEARRRARIFSFPQQVAALKDVLNQYVTDVFSVTRMDRRLLLRGVYFTSGTQEGTPIDRLLGAMGRSLAFAPGAVTAAAVGRGKAYFVERLFRDVVFPESGLAGVNRRLELRMAALQVGLYAAMVLIAVLGVIAWTVSYTRNSAYLADVAAEVQRVGPAPEGGANAPLEAVVPRLDAIRRVDDVAGRYGDGAPWSMRWGLFKGGSVEQAARDAYLRELNDTLLPRVAALVKRRMLDATPAPEKLYQYLKAYLMLGDRGRLDKGWLEVILDLQWEAAYDSMPELRDALKRHVHRLLDSHDTLRPITLDLTAVETARSTIRHASVPRIMYGELKMKYAGDERSLRLDTEAGQGLDRALARKSGKSWTVPVPALYTRKVFKEVTETGLTTGFSAADKLVTRFTEDSWVLGDKSLSITNPLQLKDPVIDLYEQDYIATWDQVLNDLHLPPPGGLAKMTEMLAIIASKESSPLRGLLKTVDANTYLVKPTEEEAPVTDLVAKAEKAVKDEFGKLLGKPATKPGPKPGAQVTLHFAPIHDLVAGTAGSTKLDGVLQKIEQVQQKLNSCGEGLGQMSAAECVKHDPGPVKVLAQDARMLPPAVGQVVAQIADVVAREDVRAAASEIESNYQVEVLQECRAIVAARYPFVPSSEEDTPLADFGRLFGDGGVFDTFFNKRLLDMVDRSTRPWKWKKGDSGASVGPAAMLRQFEAAQHIHDLYFKRAAALPEMRFTLTPVSLDSAATRTTLEVDGQSVEYRHGPVRSQAAVWPGPAPGTAAVAFEDRSGAHPALAFRGPWAWLRLLDAGNPHQESDARFGLSYALGGHSAEFVLDATSIYNPINKSDVQRFRCAY
jgi:type VI secretion system protein ImpL